MSERDDGRLRMLRTLADSRPVDVLVDNARTMHAEGLRAGSVQQVVNASVLVEFAAEQRPPGDVARIVTEFGQEEATSGLSRLVLDAAAARRNVADLDTLVGTLADRGFGGEAGRLLEAVVLRRMPRDIAELLYGLLEVGRTMLLDRLSDHRTPDECRASVVFWLRAHGQTGLALETARRMAERLSQTPPALTGLVRGLLAQQDTESADAAVRCLVGRDPRELAGMTLSLLENSQHAVHVLDDALAWLDPGELLVLASLIEEGGWPDGARRIWTRVIPGMPVPALIGALLEGVERTGSLSCAAGPLRVAAQTHAVRPEDGKHGVAELAIEVKGRIRDGEVIVLRKAAEVHPVADIFDLAGQLDLRGRGDLSHLLISEAAGQVQGRPDCGQAAEFIDLMMKRAGGGRSGGIRRRGRRQIPPEVTRILGNVAAEKDPERLMSLISGLSRPLEEDSSRSRYHDLHEYLEEAVAGSYAGPELARLPRVRRHDHLLAVLEIEKRALESPRGTIAPEEFPDVLDALRESGADEEHDLPDLLAHIGAKNRDRTRIAEAFRNRGLPAAAELVLGGHKNAPLYVVRFYPPDNR